MKDNLENQIRQKLGIEGKLEWLAGGWRKKVAKTEDGKAVAVVAKRVISKKKILTAMKLEEKFGGRKLIKLEDNEKFWFLLMNWIEGEIKWRWGEEESLEIGKKMAWLQKQGINHLDIKPGNIVWQGGKIKAVIDFEEAKRSSKYRLEDAANTLSWILLSGGSEKTFWQGYGERIASDTIGKALEKYLLKRVKEEIPGAFLLMAKNRLETYKKEVREKIIKIDDLEKYRKQNKNKKIVFTVGAWELLHWGHLSYLKKNKKAGDLLVVGVESDRSRFKRPPFWGSIIGEATRVETLAFFEMVDKVVIVEGDDISLPLSKLWPDLLVVTKKDVEEGVRGVKDFDLVKEGGGKVIVTDHQRPKISSSQMVQRVALQKIQQGLFGKSRRRPILKIKDVKSPKIVGMEKLAKIAKTAKRKTVVFTSLSADLFHLGHARFIQKAKSLGEILVVGVPSNKSIAALKGPGRPIVDETARATVLAELPYVDFVVIFDERTILECLKKLRPDVFFTVKEDWNSGLTSSPEAAFMKEIGGKIVQSERMAPYISASIMIDKAAGELIKRTFAKVLKTAEENPMINADFDPFAPESQLAAREKGFYSQVLAEVEKQGKCVFCDLKEKYLIAENRGVVLTVALYPYADGHLLIIPRRHVESIKDLNREEWEEVLKMQALGMEMLEKKMGIKNFWVLLREGRGIEAGKTVKHVHVHLLPYSQEVVRMGEAKLNILPIDLAKKLRE